jgi:hypothetical protein
VHAAVADAVPRYLQAKAVERRLPEPAVVTKRNNLLKLVAQPYVREGADLAKYELAFRGSAASQVSASFLCDGLAAYEARYTRTGTTSGTPPTSV